MRVYLFSLPVLGAVLAAGLAIAPAHSQNRQAPPSQDADRLYEECAGAETLDARAHIAACTRAIDSRAFMGEELGDLYLLRSSYHLDTGNFDAQLSDADQATRLLPNDPEPFFARGVAYARKNDLARAVPEFDAAIARDAMFADAYLERGYVHLFQGDDARALTDFSDAIRSDAMNPAAFDGRGKVYLKRNQNREALGEFDRAARLDAQDPEALYGRGLAQKRLGDARRGDADIQAALRIEPMIGGFFEPLGLPEVAPANRPQGRGR